jgi:hypothetical protein
MTQKTIKQTQAFFTAQHYLYLTGGGGVAILLLFLGLITLDGCLVILRLVKVLS